MADEHEALSNAEKAFAEEMERKPEADWLDAAVKVALQQGGPVSGPLWGQFVERVRPGEGA